MTKREYIDLPTERKHALLCGIIGALETALQVNYEWDLLPYWLRRHIAHFC